MSNTSTAPATNDPTVTVPASKIKSTLNKGVNFVKNHKKAAIAATTLAGLVVASALLEKKTGVSFAPDETVEINDLENGFEVIDTSI